MVSQIEGFVVRVVQTFYSEADGSIEVKLHGKESFEFSSDDYLSALLKWHEVFSTLDKKCQDLSICLCKYDKYIKDFRLGGVVRLGCQLVRKFTPNIEEEVALASTPIYSHGLCIGEVSKNESL